MKQSYVATMQWKARKLRATTLEGAIEKLKYCNWNIVNIDNLIAPKMFKHFGCTNDSFTICF